MERLSRAELLEEIEKRDDLIENLKIELQQYREGAFGRKIAVSAPETASDQRSDAVASGDFKFYHKDKK